MKTNFVRQCSLGLAAGLILFLGCARPSARQEQPTAVVAPPPPMAVAQAAPGIPRDSSPSALSEGAPAGETNAPAILETIPPSVTAASVALSPGLSEVVKLGQAGVNEDVMLAYVDKYSGSFDIGADQILYLNDLGISSTVITSMLKHDGSSATAATTVQAQAVSNVPQNQVYPQQPAQAEAPLVNTAVAPPSASTEVSYFYDSLSPYGSWVYLSGYGWCWQPTVAVSVPSWRPYSDRGRWYWSDAGWYWNSDYSWGWAPFHYGRWYHHSNSGWVWTPGTTWAPSWVSWRYSDGYCGWAPLPPEAHYYGSGFTYYGRGVSVGFEFGLSDFHYSFVSIGNFCDYSPARHFVPRTSVRNVYRNTTVVNNYIVGNNNTVINRGVGRETIARNSSTKVREVSVRETSVQNLASVRGDRVQRQGEQSVVYRPQLPKNPPQVKTAQFANRAGGNSAVSVGRTATAGSQSAALPSASPTRQQGRANNDARENGTGRENSRGAVAETRREQAGANPNAGATPRAGVEARRENRSNKDDVRAQRTAPNAAPATPAAPAIPQTRAAQQAQPQQPQQPQRGNRTLFGDSGARAVPQQNVTPMVRTEPKYTIPSPRGQSQPNYNTAPGARVYPQATAPLQQQQPASRYDLRNQAPSVMSPRGNEQQSPRANVPTYTAPTYSAPRSESRPESRQEVRQESRQELRQERQERQESRQSSSGGGSGRGDSGSGGGLRQGRNH